MLHLHYWFVFINDSWIMTLTFAIMLIRILSVFIYNSSALRSTYLAKTLWERYVRSRSLVWKRLLFFHQIGKWIFHLNYFIRSNLLCVKGVWSLFSFEYLSKLNNNFFEILYLFLQIFNIILTLLHAEL